MILASHTHLSGSPELPLPAFHHSALERMRAEGWGQEAGGRGKEGSTQTTALLRGSLPNRLKGSLLNFTLKKNIRRGAGTLLGQVRGRQRAPTAEAARAQGPL